MALAMHCPGVPNSRWARACIASRCGGLWRSRSGQLRMALAWLCRPRSSILACISRTRFGQRRAGTRRRGTSHTSAWRTRWRRIPAGMASTLPRPRSNSCQLGRSRSRLRGLTGSQPLPGRSDPRESLLGMAVGPKTLQRIGSRRCSCDTPSGPMRSGTRRLGTAGTSLGEGSHCMTQASMAWAQQSQRSMTYPLGT